MKTIITNIAKILSAMLVLALMISSCTNNFEDWNRPGGQPDDDEISAGNYKLWAFYPQLLNYAYPAQENAYQMGQNLVGDPYGRYLSIANTGWSTTFSTFNAPDGWINSPFNDAYEKAINAWVQIKKLSEGKGHLFALAEIGRVTALQRVTDMYGPIPYTQLGTGSVAVAYDSQEEVYKAMFKTLDEAMEILTEAAAQYPQGVDPMMARFDQVYGGKMEQWIKYANSLKLRMAMRIVYGNETLAKEKALEAINHPVGVMLSNSDNAANAFPQNPVWTVTTAWGDSRACADIIAYMNGYKDARVEKFFTPSTVNIGQPEGKTVYHGIRTGVDLTKMGKTGAYSSTTYARSDRTLWMPASEIAFLKAEGALRGWGMGASAEALYAEAITLSFSQWGATIGNYLESTDLPANYIDPNVGHSINAVSTITVKWDETADFETKLEKIITQKWIAMYPLGQEAWSEQRRTGYPRFFPVALNSSAEAGLTTKLASRIPFPPAEKDRNTANYNKAVEMLGGADIYGTRLWWDKKANKPNW